MANILFIGSGTQTLAALRPLAKNGHRIIIVANEYGNYADKSKYVSKAYYTTFDYLDSPFLDFLISIIKAESIDTLIPSGDTAAKFISSNLDCISSYVKVKAPSLSSFLQGYDKNSLMNLCREKGFPHPLTIDMGQVSLDDASLFNSFPYPGLLKPNCTTGGRGMTLIHNYASLKEIYPTIKQQYGECHLQRYIREGGHQVKIQLYIDENGKLVQSSVLDKVRWYPIKGGSSCCAVSINKPEMVNTCYQILKDIHWVGFADFDTIEDTSTHELLIMEINPRIPACIGAAINAGIDWGQIIVDGNLGNPQKYYQYESGYVLRHLGFDILWFLKSPHRFRTNPSWFKFWGKKIAYQDFSIKDPVPFIVGTYHNIKKILNPQFRKTKQGL